MNIAKPIFDIKPEHGEGPIWDPIEKKFYCVDLLRGSYYKVDWETGVSEEFSVGQELGVMALCENGKIVVGVRDGFGFFDEPLKKLELIENSPEIEVKERRMNDGAIDPKGRFFAGTMEYDGANPTGKLYCLHQDMSWNCLEENIYITNGMGWSPDKKTYYMIDTFRNLMYAYDYDIETGNISNRRLHIQWEKDEYPDGMCVDADGGFWVAMWLGSKVSHFDANGIWVKDIEVPVLHTTSCCFAGDDLKTLVITTSNLNLSKEEKEINPLAGRCFAFETEIAGQIEPRFKA
ncbi:SMP-30/gluconolactonase/LRE family protein [Winogradskyella bathintestinalis]|uniref:SMP-30/gluconolactonase/LRE family protein n=1 Tax=Winogradskyella bathintestinalis TaxID=3035208 RepID=A0ABT7ZX66_9FLAO|nr:SMP-30/gluconolactonase/LRE family protein [Winogradskyella bathintestinalis]MDN3493526.1 SMP-30/gluconolactonase/LRE family protein [Winogradskyella bathintestinalis]